MKNQTGTPAPVELKHLQLSDIVPDPNQPRHYFNEIDLQELTDSVRENGVLQPIMVRPINGGKYMVVFGERRYRASLAVQTAFKNRNTIPCTIRELTDDQALEIQIVENLQRKDVAPMEEATAFKSLLDRQIMDLESIAARVGKSTKYVTLRMKLNDLIPEFQEMLNKDKLSLGNAQLLARCHEDLQYETLNYKTKPLPNHWRENKHFKMEGFEHLLKKAQHKLSSAPFDINEIIAEASAVSCAECPFNSVNKPLLFEELSEPHCTKNSCFELKKAFALRRVIEEAKYDSSVVLIGEYYQHPNDPKEKRRLEELQKQGLNILPLKNYTQIEEPEHPGDFETWVDNEWYEEVETDEEKAAAKAEYDKVIVEYQEELKKYHEDLISEDTVKAVVALGDNAGKVIKVKIDEIQQERIQARSNEEGPLYQIDQLEQREKRNRELDIEKIHLEAVKRLRDFYTGENDLKAPVEMEWNALCYLLFRVSNNDTQNWVKAKLGLAGKSLNSYYGMEVWDAINKKGVSGILEGLIRRCFLDILVVASENDPNKFGKASAVFALANTHLPVEIQEIKDKGYEKALKRGAEVQKKIDELKKQVQAQSKKAPAQAKKTTLGKSIRDLLGK